MKIARAATLIALLLATPAAMMWLLLDPPKTCPEWSSERIFLAIWAAPFLAINCYLLFRWDYFVRSGEQAYVNSFPVPTEYALVRVCFMNAVVSLLPLFL